MLVEKIGEGASARVYRAVRSGPMGFRKEVAIKQLRPHVAKGKKAVKALINEARLGGFLRHPNIVEIHEFDRVDDTFYISMEFVQGPSLEQILQRVPTQGPIPPRIVAAIAIQICKGLDHAHSASGDSGRPINLVHRDIKPANFMITPQGVVKIMDFGIARADTNLFLTQVPGLTKGTPAYMSPEQTVGDKDDPLDHRSDLFSLASVIAEMVTGEVAFKADKLYEILHRIARADTADALALVEERAPELIPILRRAFEKDPEDRYDSAGEMCRELEEALDTLPGEEELAPWLQEWTGPPMPPGSISSTTAGNLASLDEALAMAKGSEIDLGVPVDVVDVSGGHEEPHVETRRPAAVRPLLILGVLAIAVLLVGLGAVGLGLGSFLWTDAHGDSVGAEAAEAAADGGPADGSPVPDGAGTPHDVVAAGNVLDDGAPAAGATDSGQAAASAPEAPAIIFSSSPRGAEVYLDGQRLGHTSHRFEDGRPGRRYSVTIRKDGYEDGKASAVFPEQGTVTVRARLTAVGDGSADETGEAEEAERTPEPLDAAAAVSPTTVDAIVGSNAAVKACFDGETARGGALSGRIWLKFVVHPDGHVSGARVLTPDYTGGELESCLTAQVDRLTFPRFRGDDGRVAKHYFDF